MTRRQRNPTGLRSSFAPGTSRWAVRRAQCRALCLTDTDPETPEIAVADTAWDMAIRVSRLDAMTTRARDAILTSFAAFTPPDRTTDSDWLSIHERSVTSLRHGASLIPDARKREP